MKYLRTILLFALCSAISACDIPDTTIADGAIALKDNTVTLHLSGAPDAVIDSAGDLNIDNKAVSISPSQRGLLMIYYQNVQDVHTTGQVMGKVGAKMGLKALSNKLDDKSDAKQQQDAASGGQQMEQLALKICQDQNNIKLVQDQLTAQLTVFKPYGNILSNDDVTNCQKDSKD